jgi:hypothetical protein
MGFFKSLGKVLGKIGKVALPVAAGVLGGPLLGGAAKLALGKLGGSSAGAPAGGAFPGGPGEAFGGGAPSGGLLGRIGGAIGADPLRAAGLGLAGLNVIQAGKQQGKANQINQQLLQQAQAQQAEQDRYRQMLMGRLGGGTLTGNPFMPGGA